MRIKIKYQFLLVAFGVGLYAALMNISAIAGFASHLLSIALPVVAGFLAAFVLNVPMSGFEKLYGKMFKKAKKPKNKLISALSLLSTLLCVAIVIAAVITLLIPEVISSAKTLYSMALAQWPRLASFLASYDIDVSFVTEWLNKFNLETLIGKVSNMAGSFVSTVVSFASNALSGMVTVVLSIIVAIYALLEKHTLARHTKKLLSAIFKDSIVNYLCHVGNLINQTNIKFISGQCLEACILGALIAISFAILGIPYAILIGILAAVSAFIPYFGAFFACAIGAVLILITSPEKVILCIIVYLAVQFVENQFIYPHVVGNSVGLSPLWTLVAVLVGGNLLGLFGMIFFIPVTAVAITLIKEFADARIKKKAERAALYAEDERAEEQDGEPQSAEE